jgi:hypothetical protein
METIHGEAIESYADPLPEDQFKTYEEWEQFVIEHEYQHTLLGREQFDKEYIKYKPYEYVSIYEKDGLFDIHASDDSNTGIIGELRQTYEEALKIADEYEFKGDKTVTTKGQYESEINKRALKELENRSEEDTVTLQEKMVSKLPSVIKPSAKKYLPKELVKAKIATQYIGEGKKDSSTDRYKKMYEEEGIANTGDYTSSDIIYVSSNGNRSGRVNPVKDGVLQGVYKNVQKAMDARATIVMDTLAHLERTKKYNIGELALAKYLEDNGYEREGISGIWKPGIKTTEQTLEKEADNLTEPTSDIDVRNYSVDMNNSADQFIYNTSESDIRNNKLLKESDINAAMYKMYHMIGTQSVAVDNQNNNYLELLHFNDETSLPVFMMQLQGLTNDKIFPLIAQPVIKELVVNLKNKGLGFDFDVSQEITAYENLRVKYIGLAKELNSAYEPPKKRRTFNFTKDRLYKNINEYAEKQLDDTKELSFTYYTNQIKALDAFFHYYMRYKPYVAISQLLNMHRTGIGKDFEQATNKIAKLNKLYEKGSKVFMGIGNAFMEDNYTHAIQKAYDIYDLFSSDRGQLQIQNHPSKIFEKVFNELTEVLENQGLLDSDDLFTLNRVNNAIANGVKSWIFAKFASKLSGKSAHDLRLEFIYGSENKLPLSKIFSNTKHRQFKRLTDSDKTRLENNQFIQHLTLKYPGTSFDDNTPIISTISGSFKKLDVNAIHRDLADLYETPIQLTDTYNTKDFIRDLILYDFVIGHSQTPNTISKFIPKDIIHKLVLDTDYFTQAIQELNDYSPQNNSYSPFIVSLLLHNKDLTKNIQVLQYESEGKKYPIFRFTEGKKKMSINPNAPSEALKLISYKDKEGNFHYSPVIRIKGVLYKFNGDHYELVPKDIFTGTSSYLNSYNEDGTFAKLSNPRPIRNVGVDPAGGSGFDFGSLQTAEDRYTSKNSVMSMLESIITNKNIPKSYKIIARRFRNILLETEGNNLPIQFASYLKTKDGNEAYGTFTKDGILKISKRLFSDNRYDNEHIILHEIGHAITKGYINDFLRNKIYNKEVSLLNKQQFKAIDELYDAFNKLKNNKTLKAKHENVFSNKKDTVGFHEFIVEVLSNQELRKDIDESFSVKDFIGKVIRYIKQLFFNSVTYTDEEKDKLSFYLLDNVFTLIAPDNKIITEYYQDPNNNNIVYKARIAGDTILSLSAIDNDSKTESRYINSNKKYKSIKDKYEKINIDDDSDLNFEAMDADKTVSTEKYTYIIEDNNITIINNFTNQTLTKADANYHIAMGEYNSLLDNSDLYYTVARDPDAKKFKVVTQPLLNNEINALDIKYKEVFSSINLRLRQLGRDIVTKRRKINLLEGKKAVYDRVQLKQLITELDKAKRDFDKTLDLLNTVGKMNGIKEFVSWIAEYETEIESILNKTRISSAESLYLNDLIDNLVKYLDDSTPTTKTDADATYMNSIELGELDPIQKELVDGIVSNFMVKLKREYVPKLNKLSVDVISRKVNKHSQDKLTEADVRELLAEALKDIGPFSANVLGADRNYDELSGILVKAGQDITAKIAEETAEWTDTLKDLYDKAAFALKKYVKKDSPFGLMEILMTDEGRLLSAYSSFFFEEQNKAIAARDAALNAAQALVKGRGLARKKAYQAFNVWTIRNKVAFNPKYVLSKEELAEMGITKFSKNHDEEAAKHRDYLIKTVGARKYELYVQTAKQKMNAYLAHKDIELEREKERLIADKSLSGTDLANELTKFSNKWTVLNNPIIAAEYNYDATTLRKKYAHLFPKDTALYVNNSFVQLVPIRFKYDTKSNYETDKGTTNYYSETMQMLIDNNEQDILNLHSHISDKLFEGYSILPEWKRRNLSSRDLPFFEKDFIQTMIDMPLGMRYIPERFKKVWNDIKLSAGFRENENENVDDSELNDSIINTKVAEINRRARKRTETYYLNKGIDLDKLDYFKNELPESHEDNYYNVLNRMKSQVTKEVQSLQNFDIIKIMSMYASSVHQYKHKVAEMPEMAHLAKFTFEKMGKDRESRLGENTEKQVKNWWRGYRFMKRFKPIPVAYGKVYSNIDKQTVNDNNALIEALDKKIKEIKSKSKPDEEETTLLTNYQERKEELIEENEALAKQIHFAEYSRHLMYMTQFLGLGFNYLGFNPNFIAGQLNNRYEAADGRIYDVESYKKAAKSYLKFSPAASLGAGIFGIMLGMVASPTIFGVIGGYATANLLHNLYRKHFSKSFTEKEDVAKVMAFMKRYDVMQLVQNENHKVLKPSASVRLQTSLFRMTHSKAYKRFLEGADPYLPTDAAETLNQHIVAKAIMIFKKLKDKDGNEISFLDALNSDGKLNRDLFGDKIKYHKKEYDIDSFERLVVNEVKNVIANRTQGDYRENLKNMAKNKTIYQMMLQFRSWMPEMIAIDTEGESRHMGLTDQQTGEALVVKGRYRSALEHMGAANLIATGALVKVAPLLLVSAATGAAIPTIIYTLLMGGMASYALRNAKKYKGDKSRKWDITKRFWKTTLAQVPGISRLLNGRNIPENQLFNDLISDKFSAVDAANLRALSVKMRYSAYMLMAYASFLFAKALAADDDDTAFKRLAYLGLNQIGRAYLDMILTMDPAATVERHKTIDGILPSMRIGKNIWDVANPSNWGKVYKRGDKRRGISKGDLRIIKELSDLTPGFNKYDQLDYMVHNEYSLFKID